MRKSRWSYRTLLRPKYCASAGPAAATSVTRHTTTAANRTIGHPWSFYRSSAVISRRVYKGDLGRSIAQPLSQIRPEDPRNTGHREPGADADIDVALSTAGEPPGRPANVAERGGGDPRRTGDAPPSLCLQRSVDQQATQTLEPQSSIV